MNWQRRTAGPVRARLFQKKLQEVHHQLRVSLDERQRMLDALRVVVLAPQQGGPADHDLHMD